MPLIHNFEKTDMLKSFSFIKMVRTYVTSSMLLIVATVLALVLANSPASQSYFNFWNLPVSLSVGGFNLFSHSGHELTIFDVINDFFMAIFFLSVGLEIKREILVGELASPRKAMLPIIGACGGMLIPVIVFWLIVPGDADTLRGIATPMATDIAFSLGVLSIFGKRVPLSLKVFLATLAVADDLGGIIVIATCYTAHLNTMFLLYAAVFLLIIILGNIFGMRSKMFYLGFGVALWYVVLNSGIHATIAGVALAFCIPATLKSSVVVSIEQIRECVAEFPQEVITGKNSKAKILTHEQVDTLKQIESASDRVISPLQDLEDNLHNPVNYLIIPIFAFANAGISFEGMGLDSLFSGVCLAVMAGLVVGKFLGVFSFSWLAIRTGLVRMPQGSTWKAFASVCMLSGIGFTVALFIAGLAYDPRVHADLLADAKLGILAGSVISALVSIVLLNFFLPKAQKE